MAFTRKFLKAMGIEDDKIEQIIEAHTDVTTALKEDRDKYKADAEKLAQVQKELDEANEKLDAAAKDGYKEKYEKEKKDFDEYKKGVEAAETKAKKTDAYKGLLKKAGVSEKRIDAILKVTSLDDIELDDKGEIKDADKKVEGIKTEWSEFIVKTETRGEGAENPPSGAGGGADNKRSRAAEVVAKRNEMLYGVKGENTK